MSSINAMFSRVSEFSCGHSFRISWLIIFVDFLSVPLRNFSDIVSNSVFTPPFHLPLYHLLTNRFVNQHYTLWDIDIVFT
jgi:hypothetical protein